MWIDDEKLFEILASPYHWRKKAEQMKKVGDTLKIEMERQLELLRQHALTNDLNVNAIGPMVGETCFAMYGFSLELILKGAIIFRHPEYAHDGKINRAMTNHDLIKLAGLAQVDLTDNEKVFCSNTTRMMLQFRYPVPSKMEETQFQMVVTGNFFDFHQTIYNRVQALIDGFNYVGHDENNCPKCLAVKAKEKLEVNDVNRK